MKGNKILATFIVFAMVLSTMVVLNKEEVSALTPGVEGQGVNAYGNATTDLEFGVTYTSIRIDTSAWIYDPGDKYYMYYPQYVCAQTAGLPADHFTWDGPYVAGLTQVYVEPTGGNDILEFSESITFNRSGMYIFDNNSVHDGDTPSDYAGYIWVNTSNLFSLQADDELDFGSTGDYDITVGWGTSDEEGCMIGIVDPIGTTIYHKWRQTGLASLGIEGNFSMAGTYNISAYRDSSLDNSNSIYQYQDENYNVYDKLYGSDYSGGFPNAVYTAGELYNYNNMGPWDPPELNATTEMITVNTAQPNVKATNLSSAYWGYELLIEVNVTAPNGSGIAGGNISLRKAAGGKNIWDGMYPDILFTDTGEGNYTIEIPRYVAGSSNWTQLGNTSWYLVFAKNIPGTDSTEEWNTSKRFTIKGTTAPVNLVITSDGDNNGGDGTFTDNKVDVPDFVGIAPETVDIDFLIYGRSIGGDRAYYGDNAWEDGDDIYVTGDILYPCSVVQGNLINNGGGAWTASVIPTKPGGTISLKIKWTGPDNGTDSESINIVNGSFVSANIESLTYGDETDITVTVRNMGGTLQEYGTVYLVWRDGAEINHTSGNAQPGKGENGEYTFKILAADMIGVAPHNITIAGFTPGANMWGYAKVKLTKNHNLVVNCTPTAAYAGDETVYNIDITEDGEAPSVYSDITVALYTETGKLVTGIDAWSENGKYDINDEIMYLSGGTYQLYAYNDTHDSEGYNATIEITPYSVAVSPNVLAWLIDKETNLSFEVTPAGNGTLTLENMTSAPSGAYDGDTHFIDILDGAGTLPEVNASNLGNITYSYQSHDGGESRPADGLLRITTATATPNPSTIYIGKATNIEVTITHPATGEPIEGVEVDLDYELNATTTILSRKPATVTTDGDGKVQFSIQSEANGNITIYIEQGTDPDNPFVIMSKAEKTMTIKTDPSVNEGKGFVVKAYDINNDLITDTIVYFTFDGETQGTTDGIYEFTAPPVPESLDYRIEANAEGYSTDDTTIKVINQPQLFVKAPSKGNAKKSFTVKAGGDDGNSYGITITIYSDETLTNEVDSDTTAGPDGISFTINKKGTYYIVASKANYEDSTAAKIKIAAEDQGPGFELLTLIIAIGVAYILLRRRRK